LHGSYFKGGGGAVKILGEKRGGGVFYQVTWFSRTCCIKASDSSGILYGLELWRLAKQENVCIKGTSEKTFSSLALIWYRVEASPRGSPTDCQKQPRLPRVFVMRERRSRRAGKLFLAEMGCGGCLGSAFLGADRAALSEKSAEGGSPAECLWS